MRTFILMMMLTVSQSALASSEVNIPVPEDGIVLPNGPTLTISAKDSIIGGGTQYKVTCHVTAPQPMEMLFSTFNRIIYVKLNGKYIRNGYATTVEAGDNIVTFSGISNPGWNNYSLEFRNMDNSASAKIVSCSADIIDD